MTIDAVLGIDEPAAFRCCVIDALPLGGPGLKGQHGGEKQGDRKTVHGSTPTLIRAV
jgi:hypothetical protein